MRSGLHGFSQSATTGASAATQLCVAVSHVRYVLVTSVLDTVAGVGRQSAPVWHGSPATFGPGSLQSASGQATEPAAPSSMQPFAQVVTIVGSTHPCRWTAPP